MLKHICLLKMSTSFNPEISPQISPADMSSYTNIYTQIKNQTYSIKTYSYWGISPTNQDTQPNPTPYLVRRTESSNRQQLPTDTAEGWKGHVHTHIYDGGAGEGRGYSILCLEAVHTDTHTHTHNLSETVKASDPAASLFRIYLTRQADMPT